MFDDNFIYLFEFMSIWASDFDFFNYFILPKFVLESGYIYYADGWGKLEKELKVFV